MWPDHSTQGYSLAELEEALKELYVFYLEFELPRLQALNTQKGAITVSGVVA
jgi:predicted RNase H-like HicB family nuclease